MDEITRAMQEAIKKHQGKRSKPGTAVAHPSTELIYILVRYEQDEAIVTSTDGTEHKFPASEIFDATAVRNTAVEIYTDRRIEQLNKTKYN